MEFILCVSFTFVLYMLNYAVSPLPANIVYTRLTVRLSDQQFEHIIKDEQDNTHKSHQPPPDEKTLVDLGIEYNRYLREVMETLEKDDEFKNKIENADEVDIRTGKIADELEYVKHHIRSKLDELKRQELNRLRNIAKKAYSNSSNPGHVDQQNLNSFEKKDLLKLIQQVAKDLEDTDMKRKQMFKEYEMQKHFEREQKMKQMTDEERQQFLSEETKLESESEVKHKLDPIHHPGSKKQLEEVWEKQDEMEGEKFNPRTFFVMHDIDGNGFWDEEELKALFVRELDKLYQQSMVKPDLMERAEEMERMREHVFNEVDLNRDRLISWEEFKRMSEQPNFEKDEGWKTIDQNEIYTNDELKEFEHQRQQQIDQMIQNIQVAEDLADADLKRKQIFKEYEIKKHFERVQKMKHMTHEERQQFLSEEIKLESESEVKHKLDPIHHPGSKKQLEEVWEKQDKMKGEKFNPHTFFVMHDIDGNGFWDEKELKALFVRELDKFYQQSMAKPDQMEIAEEMERMREHVFNEVDLNRDGLISWEEFKRMSEQPNFEKDEGWKTIDQNEIYTNDELKEFEHQKQQLID